MPTPSEAEAARVLRRFIQWPRSPPRYFLPQPLPRSSSRSMHARAGKHTIASPVWDRPHPHLRCGNSVGVHRRERRSPSIQSAPCRRPWAVRRFLPSNAAPTNSATRGGHLRFDDDRLRLGPAHNRSWARAKATSIAAIPSAVTKFGCGDIGRSGSSVRACASSCSLTNALLTPRSLRISVYRRRPTPVRPNSAPDRQRDLEAAKALVAQNRRRGKQALIRVAHRACKLPPREPQRPNSPAGASATA